jgi:hypothetical protein
MVENVVVYFYPQDPASTTQAPVLLDMLPTRSQEIIISNMRKMSSLTLEILKSLYPRSTWTWQAKGSWLLVPRRRLVSWSKTPLRR